MRQGLRGRANLVWRRRGRGCCGGVRVGSMRLPLFLPLTLTSRTGLVQLGSGEQLFRTQCGHEFIRERRRRGGESRRRSQSTLTTAAFFQYTAAAGLSGRRHVRFARSVALSIFRFGIITIRFSILSLPLRSDRGNKFAQSPLVRIKV